MSKRVAEEDAENVCSFFLERKKRHCRMKKAEGMSFCPHHSHLGTDLNPKKGSRIPCPYDSSHFCYESKLQKHLKKCNARQKQQPDYFIENVNIDTNGSSENNKLSLKDVPDEELLSFIQKVRNVYNELHLENTEIITMHPLLKSEIENSDDKLNNFKHMKQQASLLSLMDQFHFLQNGSCFIEFGAGKGQLMYWIIRCAPEGEKKSFILIDKSAQRHKSDNKFKDSDIEIERIRIDIQHLFLGKIQSIKDKLSNVVGVSKHLCGGATDLAMRCLMNSIVSEENGEKIKHKICGLLMALCCHHRCSWNTYTGKHFMEEHGFAEKDFKLMCCIASWATCGLRKSATENNEEHTTEVPDENLLNRYQRLNLKHEEREIIGMQCKRLIDAGRIQFLKDEGYDVRLVTYIDKFVSLENVALLATCKKN
ncbi:tRNA:m(4)X modification enzyme TRM13 homolog [Argiope bruennichi]|uniref:tRNA:m(4)X modification enzyme TRM13 homolog n=1 Tax=Argiope bruennichi TaxID=94029 RepID=UPI002495079E|nr:tRNA:m(4)X modification enzyme TRM13 homolog [Argiope bruennichi]XP_055945258.1 tRNA:m(4)X modification enzyme TRM13 homolog [Argiope bruennichi]